MRCYGFGLAGCLWCRYGIYIACWQLWFWLKRSDSSGPRKILIVTFIISAPIRGCLRVVCVSDCFHRAVEAVGVGL